MNLRKISILLFVGFFIALSSSAQYNFNKYLSDAKKDISRNNFSEAIKNLNICIQVYPAEHQSFFLRGLCKYYLNDNMGALKDLEIATASYTSWYYDACHYLALVKDRLYDFDGAIREFNKVIDKQQGADPQLYLERSFSRLSNRDYEGAIKDCNKALSMNFFSEDLYLCKGAAETELNDFDNAINDFSRALAINPRSQNAFVRKGIAKNKRGDHVEAIADFGEALKIDSGCTYAYYNRAAARIDLKDFNGAIEDYQSLLLHEPTNALAFYNKAVLHANMNDLISALADFNNVLILNPDNIQALLNRAKVKQSMYDYQGALADYDKSIQLFPYFSEAYYERSLLKKSNHDFAGAKKDYDLGKAMSELNHSKSNAQVSRDSVLLTHLTELSADFNNTTASANDTLDIHLMPIYYLAIKDSTFVSSNDNLPVLLKKSKRDYNFLFLTNKPIDEKNNLTDSLIGLENEETRDYSWQSMELRIQSTIRKTNFQLYNEARHDYNEILEDDSSLAIVYFERAVNCCKEVELLNQFNGDILLPKQANGPVKNQNDELYQHALSDLNRTIQLEPSFAIAYFNRAYVKCQLHDFNGAIKDYDNAILFDPSLANAYYNRGLFLLYLKIKLNACQDFSKAGELGLKESYAVIKRYCPRTFEK